MPAYYSFSIYSYLALCCAALYRVCLPCAHKHMYTLEAIRLACDADLRVAQPTALAFKVLSTSAIELAEAPQPIIW